MELNSRTFLAGVISHLFNMRSQRRADYGVNTP